MTAPRLLTFSDVIDRLIEYPGGVSINRAQMRQIVRSAYRDICTARNWSFLIRNGRTFTKAAVSVTANYLHTGGTYSRQLTLTSGTLSSDYQDWAVRIGDVVCDIDQIKTGTVCTLDATMNPGIDVASGTCTLYPRWYILPTDFEAMTEPAGEDRWELGKHISPARMMKNERYRTDTGDIEFYTVMAAPDLYRSLALFISPPAASAETLDYIYKRQGRQLRYTGHETAECAGTIVVTLGSAAVVGTDTSFESGMVGSILRISSSSTRPTSMDGANPYVEERSIIAVADSTNLTLDANVVTTRADVKCLISDPIDIGIVAENAFLRYCEKHLAIIKEASNIAEITALAKVALQEAKADDSRIQERKVAGQMHAGTRPLATVTDHAGVTI